LKIANKLLELQPMIEVESVARRGNIKRRESSSYSQMEAYFKKLNEDDLDYRRQVG
jgi:hypothetical protein